MVAVTGSTGHIGNVLLRELIKNNRRVKVILSGSGYTEPIEGLDVEGVKADVRNHEELVKAFRGVDVVYHLAAIISITPGKERLLYDVNVLGTRNVVNACIETGVKKLIYTGSVDAILYSRSITSGNYGRTKYLATLEVLKGVDRGLDATILSPTAVVGPYDFKPSLLGQFIINFINRKIKFYMDGGFDFVDVRDVVKAHLLAEKKGGTGENYIIGGEYKTFDEIVSILEKTDVYKKGHKIKLGRYIMNIVAALAPIYYRITGEEPLFTKDSMNLITLDMKFDSRRAEKELGYKPGSIEKAIIDTVEWFREKGML